MVFIITIFVLDTVFFTCQTALFLNSYVMTFEIILPYHSAIESSTSWIFRLENFWNVLPRLTLIIWYFCRCVVRFDFYHYLVMYQKEIFSFFLVFAFFVYIFVNFHDITLYAIQFYNILYRMKTGNFRNFCSGKSENFFNFQKYVFL